MKFDSTFLWLCEPGAAHLIGPSVEAGHFGGTFEEAEASLSQMLSHTGTEGGQTAGQRGFGVLQGLCDGQTNKQTTHNTLCVSVISMSTDVNKETEIVKY